MTEPNPQNSLTRYDTFGIRPDLFKQLTELTPTKDTIDGLIAQAADAVTQAENAVATAQAASLKSDEGKQQAIAAVTQAENAVATAQAASLKSDEGKQQAIAAVTQAENAVATAQAASLKSDEGKQQAIAAVTQAENAVATAQAASLKSDEGKQQAIAANTAAIDANNKADAAQNAAIASQQQAIAANTAAIDANNKADAAQNSAISAQQQAIAANTTAIEANNKADAAQNSAISAQQQAIAANTTAIEANNRVDAAQNDALDLLNAQQSDIAEAFEAVQAVQVREKVGFSVSGSSITNDYVTPSTGSTVCTAKGSWVGKVVITQYHSGNSAYDTNESAVTCTEYPVPNTDGTRSYARAWVSTDTQPAPHTVRVDYTIYPLTQKKVETTQGAITLPYATWTKLSSHTWTAPKTTSIMGKFSVTWSNATFLANYKIRICKNDQMLYELARNHIGPLLGNVSRTMTDVYTNYAVNAGDVITFEAYSDSSADNLSTYERGITSSAVMISWIE